MAKKVRNMISITQIDEAMSVIGNTAEVTWMGIGIEVTRTIGVTDAMSFVQDVVAACFDEESYYPEAYDFAVRRNILLRYTNVRLPESVEHSYTIVYSGIVEAILEAVNAHQLNEIRLAIDNSIEHTIEKRMNDVRKECEQMIEQLGTVAQQLSDFMSQVSPEDVQKMLGAVAETGKLDEEKLMHAYAEIKSDAATKEGSAESTEAAVPVK